MLARTQQGGGNRQHPVALHRLDRHTGGDVSGLLTEATETNKALAGDAWLLPYPSGRQCPDPDPASRVRLIGSPAHLGIAAVESLGYQAQWVLDTQTALSGRRPSQLTLAGNPLHRTPLWARIKATLAGVPTTLTTATEPVAAGAALLALHRAGLGDEPPLATRDIDAFDDELRDRYRDRLAAFIASAQ